MKTAVKEKTALCYRISANNLHISIKGSLSSQLAQELGHLVVQHQQQCSHFFIDVRYLETTEKEATKHLWSAFRIGDITPSRIFYKGTKGFELAEEGNKILVPTKKHQEGHVCKGTCPNCRCRSNKARAASRRKIQIV